MDQGYAPIWLGARLKAYAATNPGATDTELARLLKTDHPDLFGGDDLEALERRLPEAREAYDRHAAKNRVQVEQFIRSRIEGS